MPRRWVIDDAVADRLGKAGLPANSRNRQRALVIGLLLAILSLSAWAANRSTGFLTVPSPSGSGVLPPGELPYTGETSMSYFKDRVGAITATAAITAGALSIGINCESAEAQASCGDINGDNVVNGIDLAIVLTNWGPCAPQGPAWATVLQWDVDPAVVTDVTLRNAIIATGLPWRVKDTGTGIEMLLVPPGSFTMGCTPSLQYGCQSDENPLHTVTLTNAFYLGRYEVTQAQWTAKMGSNPSYFQGPSFPGLDTRPVDRVTWNMTVPFNAATGLRLPTEAEWEYAYRAQMGTTVTRWAFHNGTNDQALVGNIAWYNLNSGGQTHPVGLKQANALGFYDIAGNIEEWCSDWYGLYSSSPATNPTGPSSGTHKNLRGGMWSFGYWASRASHRFGYLPASVENISGFRSARNP